MLFRSASLAPLSLKRVRDLDLGDAPRGAELDAVAELPARQQRLAGTRAVVHQAQLDQAIERHVHHETRREVGFDQPSAPIGLVPAVDEHPHAADEAIRANREPGAAVGSAHANLRHEPGVSANVRAAVAGRFGVPATYKVAIGEAPGASCWRSASWYLLPSGCHPETIFGIVRPGGQA